MAWMDQSGQTQKTKFPFKLKFEPHDEVRNLFPKDLPENDGLLYVK